VVATVVVLLVLGAVGSGCGIPTDSDPRPLADAPTTAPPTSEGEGEGEGEATATIFLVSAETETLVPVERALDGPVTAGAALDLLLGGPSTDDIDEGLSTLIPNETVAVDVTIDEGLATVEMSEAWRELQEPAAKLAYAQVVFTLSALPGVDDVTFAVDGQVIAAPTDGESDEVVSVADYSDVGPQG